MAGAAACARGSSSPSSGTAAPPPSVFTWTPADSIATGRDHHVVFITRTDAGDWLHVVGGNTYRKLLADTWRARIGRDGSLGPWQPSTPLPAPRGGLAVAVHGRAVVLTGGQLADPRLRNTADVFVATLGADGAPGAWTPAAPLPGRRYHHASVYANGFVYVTGGVENNARFVDAVHRAPLRKDGTLGPWQDVVPGLPNVRAHVHQTPVLGDHVYSVAGSNRGQVIAQAWVGRVRD